MVEEEVWYLYAGGMVHARKGHGNWEDDVDKF
jgi:hypothetical protein